MKSKLLLYFLMLPAFYLFSHAQDASFILTPTCDGAVATITGDLGGTFSFDPDPGDGIVISFSGSIIGGTSGATYCVKYTLPGSNPVSSTECFTVLINADASFYMTPDCLGNAYATITGDQGGTFSFNPEPPDGAVIDSAGGTITGTTPVTTYGVEYTISGPCGDSSIEFVTPYCTDVFGIIEVNAFLDENSNAVFDASEINFAQGEFAYEVNNDGVLNYVNSNSGSFLIPITQEGDTYDISFTLFDVYNSCLNQTLTLIEDVTATNNETVQVAFPLTIIANCIDIAVYLTSNVPPRPGVIDSQTLTIANLGLLPVVSGSVEFTHDDLVTLEGVYFVDSGNSVTNTANGFILNFNNLQPNQQEQVEIRLNVPTTLNSGDFLTHSVVYNETDLVLENNTSTLTEEVVNSYDPNDKAESHGGKIQIDDFTESDYLYYTIRFQNLGTADALNIRIEDVLDSQLNESSFKMLAASHPYMVTRVNNNLTWQFNNVNLPPVSEDEPDSHGYVYFKIKPNTGFSVGNIIPNTADIYFDFNDAIITNTFETEFVATLSVDEFASNAFLIYPNPANDIINIRFNNNISNSLLVNVYDIQGKLIATKELKVDSNNVQLDVSKLSSGMYFVKMQSGQFKATKKIVIE